MGKIDELIKKLCPDGVSMVSLGEICSIKTGKLNANAMVKDGQYLFFTCDENPYTIDTYAFDGESILVSGNGSKVGHVNYCNGKFNAYQRTYVLMDFKTDVFFVLHYLKAYLREYIIRKSNKASVPYIKLPHLVNFKIPLPPLAVQKEIVEILDTFTGMIDNLQKELEQRQKQFEYYRNVLLYFENGEAEINELNKIAEYSKSRIEASGLNNANYVSVENLLQNKEGKVDSACCPTEGRWTKFMPGDILVGNIRPYLKKIWYADCEGGTNGDVLDIRVTSDKVSSKYLFKVLASDNFFEYDTQSSAGAKMPRGKKNVIMKYHVPIPSLEKQQEIVDKLDTFEALISNIKQEIELRQKQYEYYREKLLTFE